MLTTILVGVGAALVSSVLGYFVGQGKGRKDKLNELHELQEEGWLSITYNGDPSKGTDVNPTKASQRRAPRELRSGAQHDERIDALMERGDIDIENELGIVVKPRSRRDAEERRSDWAKAMKNNRTDELLNEELEEVED